MDAIKVIVGLGNPGSEYSRTRHNAGFWFIDALAESARAPWGLDKKIHAETAKMTNCRTAGMASKAINVHESFGSFRSVRIAVLEG